MKERPILFSAPMVRAILEGRKTQTRRAVKGVALSWLNDGFTPQFVSDYKNGLSPYGQVGDRLWVRESCWIWGVWLKNGFTKSGRQKWRFKAVGKQVTFEHPDKLSIAQRDGLGLTGWVRRPSIHLPRWASRITLEITGVRVERLQDISEADCIEEGIDEKLCAEFTTKAPSRFDLKLAAIHAYAGLWESINGPESWAENPWVWVVEFKRVGI